MASIFIGFKQRMAYRADWILTIFAALTSILIQMALWKYLYAADTDKINYMTGYVIYVGILNSIYTNRIYHILAGKILNGDFVLDLIKPVNIVWFSYLKSLGESLAQTVLQTFPLIIIFSPIILKVTIWNNFGLYLGALFLGHILFSTIYAIIGFTAFIFVDVWALRRLAEDTIKIMSGALLPIALFPESLKKIVFIFPFHYLYDFPLQILLNLEMDVSAIRFNFINAILWEIVLLVLLCLIYKIATYFCVVQGG